MDLQKWFPTRNNMKPEDGFSMSIAALLGGLNAEIYIPIFRKYNLGKRDLEELTEEDLVVMGVDSPEIRKIILSTFEKKTLESTSRVEKYEKSSAIQLLTNLDKQLKRIRLAILFNGLSLQNDPKPQDILLFSNAYATTVITDVIQKIDQKLESISQVLIDNLPENHIRSLKKNRRKEKMVVGTVGGILIVMLSCCLVKSLKAL